MSSRTSPPTFITVAAFGGPQPPAQALMVAHDSQDIRNFAPAEVGGLCRPRAEDNAMSRLFRSDLLLGLAGFALGAAGLLAANVAEATPRKPSGETNLVARAETARR